MDKNKTRIGIVGLGLIGGSLALSLNGKYDVLGWDADGKTRAYAAENGFCTLADLDRMSECDVIFSCVPIAAMRRTLDSIYAAVGDASVITDVASVKSPFVSSKGRYVGGHPMAGTENGGILSAKPHLFQNAYWCITTDGGDADIVRSVVKATGAIPVDMTADEHDRSVAVFSHTPHAVAYALVNSALKACSTPIAGSGFLDTTRIAKSDEKFWTNVFKLNGKNVTDGISSVIDELKKVKSLIEGEEFDKLEEYIRSARNKRQALDRADLSGEELYVDLVDRIGEFERITGAISRAGINMTNIALVPSREGAGGALRIEFSCSEDKERAAALLNE